MKNEHTYKYEEYDLITLSGVGTDDDVAVEEEVKVEEPKMYKVLVR